MRLPRAVSYSPAGKKIIPGRDIGNRYSDFRFIPRRNGIIGVGTGYERRPAVEVVNNQVIPLAQVNLAPDIYIFHGVYIDDDEYWICSQKGAYRWNKKTGETKCFLPNERVSDIVKDYQGNYWFSTLDNGVFFCASLYNSLLKVYDDPVMNNFTRIQALPNGEVLAGNSLGIMGKINLETRQTLHYRLIAQVETEFISYYGNRKTEAGELLGNFSDLMRKTLQASDKQLLPLQDEIENLRLYLELEKARFDEGFSYKIDIANIDDLSSIYIPSLMLQPFAENSVKHGLMHKPGNKKVEILFEKQADGLSVVIEDNGIGRIHSIEINQRSHNKPFSFATEALNERMNLFNRLYKHKITCRIIDKTGESQQSLGTRIELFIPDYSNDRHAL